MKKIFLSLIFVLSIACLCNAQIYTSKTATAAGAKMQIGDMPGAVAILTKAIDANKDIYEAHVMRGNIRSMTGDLDGAIADYTASIEIGPATADVYEKRAFFRRFRNDFPGAVKDLDVALPTTKFPARVLVLRGQIKTDLNDNDGAIKDFQSALAYDRKIASAVIGISDIKQKTGDIDGAILVLKDFLDRFEGRHAGKEPTANVNMAGGDVVVKREGGSDKTSETYLSPTQVARVTLTDHQSSDPEVEAARMEQMLNVAHAYDRIAQYYYQKGEDDAALENIEKDLKINPQDPNGYSQRSQIHWKREDLAGVIDDMTTLVNLPMRSPGIHRDRAILLILQGKDAEAAVEFSMHQKAYPAYTDEKVKADIDRAKKLRDSKHPAN